MQLAQGSELVHTTEESSAKLLEVGRYALILAAEVRRLAVELHERGLPLGPAVASATSAVRQALALLAEAAPALSVQAPPLPPEDAPSLAGLLAIAETLRQARTAVRRLRRSAP